MYQAAENRYETMEYKRCGRSGLKLPRVALGLWQNFGLEKTITDQEEILCHAFDRGITHFDLANNYGHPARGLAEENFGRALKDCLGPYRNELAVSTKAGYDMWQGPYGNWGSRKYLMASLDQSLRRMGLDYVDIFYHHRPDPETPLEETMEAMMKLKEQGKIRAIGASNVTSDIIRGYCRYGQLDVIQEKYSLLTRRIEKQLLPTCKELGVSVQAYSPLEQGLLTGKVTMDTTYPEGSTRNTNPCFQPTRRAQALELLAKWGDLTEKYDCTMTQLVIAMTARMIPGLHVLCGARKPEQVLDNAGALHIKLDGADAVRMKWDVDAIS